MQRINGYHFYQLGGILTPLEDIKRGDILADRANQIWSARMWLEWFLDGSIVPISFSKTSGSNLLAVLKRLVPNTKGEITEDKLKAPISTADWVAISSGIREFRTVLNTELARLDTYFISRTGIYSTPDLIEHAEFALPPQIVEKLSETVKVDIRQGGRCLAFGLPTAAGFHIMRAIESVMLEYCEACLGKKPNRSNWGNCINELEKSKADKKVLAVLDQIRLLHRNPTIHPEEILSDSQALTLFGIAQSAIIAMIDDLGNHLTLKENIIKIVSQ